MTKEDLIKKHIYDNEEVYIDPYKGFPEEQVKLAMGEWADIKLKEHLLEGMNAKMPTNLPPIEIKTNLQLFDEAYNTAIDNCIEVVKRYKNNPDFFHPAYIIIQQLEQLKKLIQP